MLYDHHYKNAFEQQKQTNSDLKITIELLKSEINELREDNRSLRTKLNLFSKSFNKINQLLKG